MEVSGLNTAASLDVSGLLSAWKCDPVSRKPISNPSEVGGAFSGHYGREISAGDRKSINFINFIFIPQSFQDYFLIRIRSDSIFFSDHLVVLGAHVAHKIQRVFCFGTSNTYGQVKAIAKLHTNIIFINFSLAKIPQNNQILRSRC